MQSSIWHPVIILLLLLGFLASYNLATAQPQPVTAAVDSGRYLNYEVEIPATSRYACKISAVNLNPEPVRCWLEELTPDQTYARLSADFLLQAHTPDYQLISIPHCALTAGKHWLRVHFSKGGVVVNFVRLSPELHEK